MSGHTFSFYLPALASGDRTARLTGDEHAHLKRVLRLRPGETIRITNGLGLVVRATVDAIDDRATSARVVAVESEGPPAPRLALALPLLQRAHFDLAVAQCVEVGVTDFIPVLAERCHVRAWTDALAARTERVAVAAMKQSGRGWLPVLHDAVTVDGLAATFAHYPTVVLADADAAPLAAGGDGGDALAIVGPEAGFSGEERDRLVAAGARPASISRHRLRAETAAVVLVSLLAPRG